MTSIGSVSIVVNADASGVPSEIEKATSGPLAKLGASMGKQLSAALAKNADADLLGRRIASAMESAASVGQKALSGLGAAAQRAIDPAVRQAHNFAAGFNDAQAASSALTGVMGSLGGTLRSVLDPAITQVQNFRAGLNSSREASSALTGVMGSFGGVMRVTGNLGKAAWDGISSAASLFAPVAQKALSAVGTAAQKTWDAIKSGAQKAWNAIAAGMRGTLETAAKLTGGALAGVLGTSLAKGFARLSAIDNAEAALRGLTATAGRVPEIMEAATNSVTGTAFSLAQAATAASQLAAAQVPVEDMERHLSALANAAAGAGGDFDGMASIFAKVAARGSVTSEVLNSLTDRGVSGLAALADHFDISTAAVQKMVTAGEVSFDDFSRAMDAAMGQAAIEQATTFSGLMSNVGASMGRFGATMQKPIFDSLKAVMPGVMALFNELNKAIAPVAEIVSSALVPAAERLGEMLSGLSFGTSAEGASSFLAALGPLLPVIGGLLGMMGPMLSQIPVLGSLFSGLTGPVGLFAGALVALVAIHPADLLDGFDAIASALPGMITKIAKKAAELLPTMLSRIVANAGTFITGIVNILVELVPAIAEAIPMIVTAFAEVVPQMIMLLLSSIPTFLGAALQLFQAITQAIIVVLPQVIATLIALLPQIADAILTALPLIVSAALELFSGIMAAMVEATPLILDALMALLPELIEVVMGMLPDLIDAALELFLGIVSAFLDAAPQILKAVIDILPDLTATVISMLPDLIAAALKLFLGIVEAVPDILPDLIDALLELLPEMVDTIVGMIPDILQAGMDLIGGLVQGLLDAAWRVGETLLKIINDAVGGFLSFLGIASPSKLFRSFGENIGEGLADGLDSSADLVDDAMDSLIPPSVSAGVDVNGTALAPGASAFSSGSSSYDNRRTVTIAEGAITAAGPDPRRVAYEVLDLIAEEVSL